MPHFIVVVFECFFLQSTWRLRSDMGVSLIRLYDVGLSKQTKAKNQTKRGRKQLTVIHTVRGKTPKQAKHVMEWRSQEHRRQRRQGRQGQSKMMSNALICLASQITRE